MPEPLNPNSQAAHHRVLLAIEELNREDVHTVARRVRADARTIAARLDLDTRQVLDVALALETLGWITVDTRGPRRQGDGHDRKIWRLTPAGGQQLLEV